MNVNAVQRRTLRLLFVTQIISGVGVAVGASVGALLAADIAGVGMSGLAQSAAVIGTALFAVPATAIVNRQRAATEPGSCCISSRRSARSSSCSRRRGDRSRPVPGILSVRRRHRRQLPGALRRGGPGAAGAPGTSPLLDRVGDHAGRGCGPQPGAGRGRLRGPVRHPHPGGTVLLLGAPVRPGDRAAAAVLRPDPAVVARAELGRPTTTDSDAPRPGMRPRSAFVLSHPAARLGVSAMAIGNVVMIGVMAMTPVHIREAGHDAAHTLRIVGIVLSFHIAGMYAFSPVFGWLTDRLGRRPVIIAGIALLLAACALAGTAGHDTARLAGRTDDCSGSAGRRRWWPGPRCSASRFRWSCAPRRRGCRIC